MAVTVRTRPPRLPISILLPGTDPLVSYAKQILAPRVFTCVELPFLELPTVELCTWEAFFLFLSGITGPRRAASAIYPDLARKKVLHKVAETNRLQFTRLYISWIDAKERRASF